MEKKTTSMMNIKTKEGHFIQIHYSSDTEFITVDVVHKDECCGTEIVRMKIDVDVLLAHHSKECVEERGKYS